MQYSVQHECIDFSNYTYTLNRCKSTERHVCPCHLRIKNTIAYKLEKAKQDMTGHIHLETIDYKYA